MINLNCLITQLHQAQRPGCTAAADAGTAQPLTQRAARSQIRTDRAASSARLRASLTSRTTSSARRPSSPSRGSCRCGRRLRLANALLCWPFLGLRLVRRRINDHELSAVQDGAQSLALTYIITNVHPGRVLCVCAVQHLHVWPHLPRRELQHDAPPGRVLDDRAGDRLL